VASHWDQDLKPNFVYAMTDMEHDLVGSRSSVERSCTPACGNADVAQALSLPAVLAAHSSARTITASTVVRRMAT
jgi:hypothetical protein